MMEELARELPATNSSIRVSALEFARQISEIDKMKLPRKNTVAYTYVHKVLKKLYFPLHVRENHWVAGVIDFEERSFCFGKDKVALPFKQKTNYPASRFFNGDKSRIRRSSKICFCPSEMVEVSISSSPFHKQRKFTSPYRWILMWPHHCEYDFICNI